MSIPATATAYPLHGDHIPPHHHHHHLHNPSRLSHIAAAAANGVVANRGPAQVKVQAYSNPSNGVSNVSTAAPTATASSSTGTNGSSSSSSRAGEDGMYGHSATAHLVANFITALFNCPSIPPTPSSSSSTSSSPNTSSSSGSSQSHPQPTTPPLANFVAYALHRTRLHSCVTFTALFLLSRLKSRFPNARGSSGHRLFISAFMIASKVVCDDTYSNKSWCVVGQNMFSLREVNQMEREMCGYLEWGLCVDPEELEKFEQRVREEYTGSVPPVAKKPASSAVVNGRPVLTPINTSLPPATRPHPPPPSSTIATVAPSPTSSVSSATSGITQLTAATAHTVRQMLPTPPASPGDPSHSAGPSPASSTSCLTPPSGDDVSGAAVVTAPTPNGGVHVQSVPAMEKPTTQSQQVQVVGQRSFGGAAPAHHQQHAGVQRTSSFVSGAVSVW